MTASRDVEGEMRNLFLDRGTADRLLSGRVQPDDAPPAYSGVAEVLRAATWTTPVDPERERTTISAMSALIAAQPVRQSGAAPVGARPSRIKVMSLVVAATLVGTTGLAFAGALPPPAQNAAHTLLAHVGITIPEAEADPGARVGVTRHPSLSPSPPRSSSHEPHGQAGQSHGQAGQPHGQAGQPHGQAGQPHGNSEQTGGTS